MDCPLCGSAGAYAGLVHLECARPGCPNYKPQVEAEPAQWSIRAVWYELANDPTHARWLTWALEDVALAPIVIDRYVGRTEVFVRNTHPGEAWTCECVHFERYETKEDSIKDFLQRNPGAHNVYQ